MRVFAGPNGSGKSTIIKAVRDYQAQGHPIDFGVYVNADDIAAALRKGTINLDAFRIKTTPRVFLKTVQSSGLLSGTFTPELFSSSYKLHGNKFTLLRAGYVEQIAQILADFLRKQLLLEKKKFSFETVFSHPSKLDIMREAAAAGYKVYLYFVSTESPEINKTRVLIRRALGGHDVPPDKIESRYYRSLEQLYAAAQLAYQAYFFDNSDDASCLFAQFKMVNDEQSWTIHDAPSPEWFGEYFIKKWLLEAGE